MADPKSVVRTFFEKLTAGATDEAFQVVADDVVWWVPGRLPFSGTKDKAGYMVIVGRIRSGFPQDKGGLRFQVMGLVGEGDKVAAEVESDGVHTSGRRYQNKYHFLFTVQGGRVTAVKEYMDTLHLFDLISPPPPS